MLCTTLTNRGYSTSWSSPCLGKPLWGAAWGTMGARTKYQRKRYQLTKVRGFLGIVKHTNPLDAHLTVNLSDVKDIVNPLSKVEAGLQAAGADVPLEAVHIRAKLVDLAARVHRLLPCPFSPSLSCLFSHSSPSDPCSFSAHLPPHTTFLLPHPPTHPPPTQVIVLQAYKNISTIPIEAKYVFPLDDMAAG